MAAAVDSGALRVAADVRPFDYDWSDSSSDSDATRAEFDDEYDSDATEPESLFQCGGAVVDSSTAESNDKAHAAAPPAAADDSDSDEDVVLGTAGVNVARQCAVVDSGIAVKSMTAAESRALLMDWTVWRRCFTAFDAVRARWPDARSSSIRAAVLRSALAARDTAVLDMAREHARVFEAAMAHVQKYHGAGYLEPIVRDVDLPGGLAAWSYAFDRVMAAPPGARAVQLRYLLSRSMRGC
uniref:Uncharacterized protein n=1 Tax=viral metagenome TaxID=1070528 RepID=A0A6C0ATC0_9ZZZZ